MASWLKNPTHEGSMGNVLIIDDDEMMCEALSTLVKRMGHDLQQPCWLRCSKASTGVDFPFKLDQLFSTEKLNVGKNRI